MTAVVLHHGLGPPSTVTVEQRLPNGRLLVRFPNGGTMIVPSHLTGPTHRGDDTDTAVAAGDRDHTTDRERALAVLRAHPAGLTDHELADLMGRVPTSSGKRRLELVRLGYVIATKERRPTPSGAMAIVWRAVEHAGKAA